MAMNNAIGRGLNILMPMYVFARLGLLDANYRFMRVIRRVVFSLEGNRRMRIGFFNSLAKGSLLFHELGNFCDVG